ncbi:bifunctional 3'-5' exonuclease/DNA polymerase [Cellulomonas sp. APG4]|uniref:bifunctional 3'-5' exonuclease/DNA polymerase n=1 Tax=Cellulomonas sp. APG4 TaxID=1538656 RepID=UPI00137B5E53|nr:bifunctional 3'-5' exonuclease/DNA polymerase [Cellulomonas sp. APG4]NCT89564.1 bifunctional 3'-5' exonuclease/DNA polymerase [Cellulomonas sp. APG4]
MEAGIGAPEHDDERAVVLVETGPDGAQRMRRVVTRAELAAEVGRRERTGAEEGRPPRWVWADTSRWAPDLIAAGVRVERCHDLRLCHRILRASVLSATSELARAPRGPWDESPGTPAVTQGVVPLDLGIDPDPHGGAWAGDAPGAAGDALSELRRQLAAVDGSAEPGRLRLLLAAESAGALIAAEMHHDGLPWDVEEHDRLLTEALGPRPSGGRRPARLEELAAQVRTVLDRPDLNPDSQPELLRALRAAGVPVTSTRTAEIRAAGHPVSAPLLAYKKLARLYSANGWHWAQAWVREGRFRPEYVPGRVVTGRWASSGGGALQLPAAVRAAVRAEPGHRLVVADAAQLEPRVLAAMSGDAAMAAAGRSADLYQGLVDAGVVATRTEAKYAMLGAIYGATTGAGGALLPRLRQAFPAAMDVVERAARAGERGEVVATWLGRTSPADEVTAALRHAARAEGADAEQVRLARRRAQDHGRFTRNFVVQGTAAEWALCWMAALRRRLRALPGEPRLVFFLHDEVLVHTPTGIASRVAEAVVEAATEAGRLLFGSSPVEFPLDVAVVESYDEAA